MSGTKTEPTGQGTHIMVYTLAESPIGDVVLVKTRVLITADDDDYSMEIDSGERLLRSKFYTVYGSFLESQPAALLVDLDGCLLVE